jgi:hypothetical protein
MLGADHAAFAKLIADIIERMPRSDPEAVALRIIGSLDQAGYEIRPKTAPPRIIGFEG